MTRRTLKCEPAFSRHSEMKSSKNLQKISIAPPAGAIAVEKSKTTNRDYEQRGAWLGHNRHAGGDDLRLPARTKGFGFEGVDAGHVQVPVRSRVKTRPDVDDAGGAVQRAEEVGVHGAVAA